MSGKPTQRFLLVVVVLVASGRQMLSCAVLDDPAGDECTKHEDCAMGNVCYHAACAQVCNRDQDCARQDQACSDGVCVEVPGADCAANADCVAPGPCEVLPGICTAGKCDYPPDACNTPPVGECPDSDTYVGHYARGTCDPAQGECEYTSFEVPCTDCKTNCLGTCDAVTCNETQGGCAGRGRCLPGSPPVCEYEQASNGTLCEHQTSDDARCVGGECRDCGAGECVGVLGLGAVCTEPEVCASGFCTNGHCCESACGNGICLASGHCGCAMNLHCDAGSVCVDGTCLRLCFSKSDCSGGETCVDALCVPDTDDDGVADDADNCVDVRNAEQVDHDLDGLGDACDVDVDGDAYSDAIDNCPFDANADQVDSDSDNIGDVCDDDDDGDGVADVDDDCRLGVLGVDVCDDDVDGDGIPGSVDNCSGVFNPPPDGTGDQLDIDGDGLGDVCDYDMDGDGAMNWADNCIHVYNPEQEDADGDGLGDACDS